MEECSIGRIWIDFLYLFIDWTGSFASSIILHISGLSFTFSQLKNQNIPIKGQKSISEDTLCWIAWGTILLPSTLATTEFAIIVWNSCLIFVSLTIF